jgi:hypothetical protein
MGIEYLIALDSDYAVWPGEDHRRAGGADRGRALAGRQLTRARESPCQRAEDVPWIRGADELFARRPPRQAA